jgi:hypothetical protein
MGWAVRLTELLLAGMAGWTGLGIVGIGISQARGEEQRVRRGGVWLVSIWMAYMCALLGVSLTQKQAVVAIGQPQCFGEMCFTVVKVEEVKGFLVRDGRRLLQVSVQITNRGHSAESEDHLQAYLVDAQGRRWEESPGVNGVGLTTRVAGGDSVVSEPVFKIAGNATSLKLVLTRGWMQPGVLMIGDSDSVLHKKTVVALGQ